MQTQGWQCRGDFVCVVEVFLDRVCGQETEGGGEDWMGEGPGGHGRGALRGAGEKGVCSEHLLWSPSYLRRSLPRTSSVVWGLGQTLSTIVSLTVKQG